MSRRGKLQRQKVDGTVAQASESGKGMGRDRWWVQSFLSGDDRVLNLDYGYGYTTL